MNTRKTCLITAVWVLSLGVGSTAGYAAEPQPSKAPVSDKKIYRQIRSAIIEDQSLPYCATRMRVESRDGKVTLKGKVKTEEQKEKVIEKASAIAGEENVISDIRVTGL